MTLRVLQLIEAALPWTGVGESYGEDRNRTGGGGLWGAYLPPPQPLFNSKKQFILKKSKLLFYLTF